MTDGKFSSLETPIVSDARSIVLIVIKLRSDDYDNLRPFLQHAPVRLKARVLALTGSRPIRAGYSWTEEIGGNRIRWRGLAVVVNSVLLVDAITPAYSEDPHELHKHTDARVTLLPRRSIKSLEAIEAERTPESLFQDEVKLACQWAVSFSDDPSVAFPDWRRSGSQEDERAELLASALADLLDR